MPFLFFSQIEALPSRVHHLSSCWRDVIDRAKAAALFVVPNRTMVQEIQNYRPDVSAISYQDMIMTPIHAHIPSPQCFWIHSRISIGNDIQKTTLHSNRHPRSNSRGLWCDDVWIDPYRTFGVEIELTSHDFVPTRHWKYKKWKYRAHQLLGRIRSALGDIRVCNEPTYTPQEDYQYWQVVYDSSSGWEIVSPILLGKTGVEELKRVITSIQDIETIGLIMQSNTGIHLHLSWNESLSRTKKLLHWWYFFEPSLATLVHPQRIFAHHQGYFCKTYSNGYCVPLTQSTEGSFIQEAKSVEDMCLDISRHTSINLHSILQKQTIEFRMFESTKDIQLLLLWLSLCQQIAHVAAKKRYTPSIIRDWSSTALTPTGDAALLSYTYLPAGRRKRFLQLIIQRRRQIATYWCRNASLHTCLPFINKWRIDYDEESSS